MKNFIDKPFQEQVAQFESKVDTANKIGQTTMNNKTKESKPKLLERLRKVWMVVILENLLCWQKLDHYLEDLRTE
ncbi:hypothetical protein RIR_e37357_A0A2N1M4E6_9GLOMa [Rhizophagus irregularis DAOM 181602=DAOM 197198]|nr:hypothetical protein RIR_e37357_A0A2N1M4E6_9GLOMa [Rhizophagus irregularis DAOM 181602=DAOM 197198]